MLKAILFVSLASHVITSLSKLVLTLDERPGGTRGVIAIIWIAGAVSCAIIVLARYAS